MELIKENKKEAARIICMLPINSGKKDGLNPFEKELTHISNCLEDVYQELHELDEIIDESLSDA